MSTDRSMSTSGDEGIRPAMRWLPQDPAGETGRGGAQGVKWRIDSKSLQMTHMRG
jgi:hypothetical protein